MRSASERKAIDRMLASHGLGQLKDGAGLVAQLGFLVTDHEHFRSILARCEPEERSNCYDAMKPYIRFQVKELSEYMAESALKAEREKLPTLEPDGSYKWPSDARVTGLCACKVSSGWVLIDETVCCKDCRRPYGDGAMAQAAVNEAFAKKRLTLTCMKCTKEESFTGDTRNDCILNARRAGWAYWERGEGKNPGEICPDCPSSKVLVI